MNSHNFRVSAPSRDSEEKVSYLQRFRTLYPNGLGDIDNDKYLELCKSDFLEAETCKSSSDLKKYLDVDAVSLDDESIQSQQSQSSGLSVTLTPG